MAGDGVFSSRIFELKKNQHQNFDFCIEDCVASGV